LGVNGPTLPSAGRYNNYLVSGNRYIRATIPELPIGNQNRFAVNSFKDTTTRTDQDGDVILTTTTRDFYATDTGKIDGTPLPPGSYPFNWGVVTSDLRSQDPSRGFWYSDTCDANLVITAPLAGCTDISATNYNNKALVDDGSCFKDLCSNITGVQAVVPPGYIAGTIGSRICTFPPLSCDPTVNLTVSAGIPFIAKKSFKNDNALDFETSNVWYQILGIAPADYASPRAATITAGNSVEYSTMSHTINIPGVYTVAWSMQVEPPGARPPFLCRDTITVTASVSCSATTFSVGTLDKLVPRVTITNETNVPINITSAKYVSNPSKISWASTTALGPTSGRNTTFEAPETAIDNPGEYVLSWTVQWNLGSVSETISCQTDKSSVSNRPYARFYGNDVFAGGGFGDNCSSSGVFDARGYGNGASQSTYKGTASELAVFAIGQIQNVLPGSQYLRTGPEALAFANTTTSLVVPDTGGFGGGFGSVLCSPDYYSKASSANVLPNKATNDLSADISTSGSYRYGSGGKTVLTTGAGIADGKRLVIYVDGDVQIKASPTGRFGYSNASGNWPGGLADVPSLYVIASGNIYIDSDVTTMDGVYIAQQRPTDISDETGRIYSCSRNANNPAANLSDKGAGGDAAFVLSNCNRKLTVNGSFLAKRVYLLRSLGTVNDGKPYESYKDATNKIAEIFRFTPEIYLIEAGGGLPPRSTTAKIDSIVALPPAF